MTTPTSSPTHVSPCLSLLAGTGSLPSSATPPREKRLSEAALQTLATTEEFLPSIKRGEKLYEVLMRHPALCSALREIDSNIIRYIAQKEIADKGMQKILAFFSVLKKLNLAGFSSITDNTLPSIANLEHLTSLNLCGTKIVDLTPLVQKPLKYLKTLNLYQTTVNYESLKAFLKCHKITVLTLPKNPPKGFFHQIPLDSFEDVTLHVNESREQDESMTIEDLIHITNGTSLKILQIWLSDIEDAYHIMIGVKRKRLEVVCITDDQTVTIKHT